MIGEFASGDRTPAEHPPPAPVTTVRITGDLADDPRAMGLAEDISSLVTAFLRHPPDAATTAATADCPAPDDGVEISLPGLPLDADAHRLLVERIRRLVAQR